MLPLVFNVTSKFKYSPDVDAVGAGVEVKSLQEALVIIKKLIKNKNYWGFLKPGMVEFRKKYFAAGGEDAVRCIIKELSN